MHPALTEAARRCPEPGAVQARLERIEEAGARLDTAALAGTLVPVVSNSRFLTAFLVRHPEEVETLRDPSELQSGLGAETLRRWFRTFAGDAPGDAEASAALRRVKYRAYLRITARDVAQIAPVPETCAEISTVAEVCTALATEHALAAVAARSGPPVGRDGRPVGFVVLGMGKLGGHELNYSSDVDLIYFYAHDDGAAGPLTLHQHFTRVGELLTRLLAEVTAEGFVYRVDLRLRPEGQSGPLCNSLPGAESYYESWGRTWERVAWLRARPVGGDLALGDALLARLAPWIYRRTLDYETLNAIRDQKQQILQRRQAAQALGRTHGIDVKLDRGGIRAVEFHANALQLLHAGREPRLRDPSTLGALDRLSAAGHLASGDRDRLVRAYLFFRRVEHRIQMEDERQTQRLPTGAALDALAARLGFEDGAPGRALVTALDAHRDGVARLFEDLLARTDAGPEETTAPEASLLLSLDATAEDRVAIAQRFGFADPAQFAHLVEVGARRPDSPLSPRASAAAQALGRALLTDVLRSPAPERALTHLVAFLGVVAGRRMYLEGLAERPERRRLLINVFATSDFLSDRLLRAPALLDVLYQPPTVVTDGSAASDALGELLARLEGDDEACVEALARHKQHTEVAVGVADLAGELDVEGVGRALTALAERTVGHVAARAATGLERRFGLPARPPRWCVLGMGKLGGGELAYGSDLDVVFLFDPEGAADLPRLTTAEWYTRAAQRTISLLGLPTRAGALYAIDTRLRPGGSQGTLVVPLSAFSSYHEQRAGVWERLALVRARPVAGHPDLCARVAAEVSRLAYDRPPPPALCAEVRRLRRRVEAEVAREDPGRYNPKSGRGGLVDLELIVQSLQIEHGAAHPALRTPNTVQALRSLRDARLLEGAEFLVGAFHFLRRLEHRLRIERGRANPELRTDRVSLDALARRLGYDEQAAGDGGPGERLRRDYERITTLVRTRFEERFGPVEPTGEANVHQV